MAFLKRTLPIAFLLLTTQVSAQNEANFWHFGGGAFDFSSGSAVSIPHVLYTDEGSAAMSDAATGNLLMYTDGVNIRNAAGVTMPNGGGIMGDVSTTQASVIVPQPGHPNIYYVFTGDCLEDYGVFGYRYSVVDMTLAGGMGDVVVGSKNILLYDTCSEQLSAVKHANCIDWWIMTKERFNNVYNAYLLTASGISGPVVSSVGLPVGFSSFGQAKFSPDGTHYAITTATITQLFDFDNATGMLSNPISIVGGGFGPGYGLSFSGDNSKLYMCKGSAANQIYQFDLSSGVPATIIASGVMIGNSGGYNQLHLAKNGKIYVSHDGFPNYSVINSPNTLGTACNFVLGAIPISGVSKKGVCNFPDSYFNETSPCLLDLAVGINHVPPSCHNDTNGMVWINVMNSQGPYTVIWSPGGETTDTIHNIGAGTYSVTVTDSAGNTFNNSVTVVEPSPLVTSLTATKDSVCTGDLVVFIATPTGGTNPYHFSWSFTPYDTPYAPTTTLSTSGYVHVTVTDTNGCTRQDSIYITVLPAVNIHASADTCICLGEQAVLQASGTTGYLWNTGDTTASITVSPVTDSWYNVSWSNGACSDNDSIFVCVYPLPVITLSGEDSLCLGLPVTISSTISSGTPGFTYSWSTSPTDVLPTVTFTPATTTLVQLEVTDANGCTDQEDHLVNVFPVANVHASEDTCICMGESVTLSATGAPFYAWSNGENTASITITPVTDTLLTVSYGTGPCTSTDSVFVCLLPLPVVIATGDTSVEYHHPVELVASGDPPFYWSPGESLSCSTCNAPMAMPETTTIYTVTAINDFGCMAQDTVIVEIFYVVRIPNIITPNGDGLNDVFKITGLPPASVLHIFNRWGNEVFMTDHYLNDWQGEVDGVYYYVLQTPDGRTFSGFVQVTGR